jgi:hypothetical protein
VRFINRAGGWEGRGSASRTGAPQVGRSVRTRSEQQRAVVTPAHRVHCTLVRDEVGALAAVPPQRRPYLCTIISG